MEYNIVKQNVYVAEPVFNQNLEQPIDTEFTLPDYCPDIDRIIKCVIEPRTAQKSFNGDMLNIDGIAELCLFYTDGSQVRCHEHQFHFSRQVPLHNMLSNASAKVVMTTEYVNCRAVSKRRVDVHASLNLNVTVTTVCEHNIVADIDSPSVHTLLSSTPATTPMGMGEKYILFSDEIEVPSTNSPIKTLLRTDARAIAHEAKIIGNKVVIKGELTASFFYIGENDGKPEHFTSSMPISQIVDIDRLNDSCTATAEIEINELEVKTHTSAAGEISTVSLSAKLTVSATAYCNLDVPIVLDAYSTDYDMELEHKPVKFKKIDSALYDNFICKENVEFGADNINEIIDVWCQPRVTHYDIADNLAVVKGIATVNILAVDADNYPRFYEKQLEFDYEHPCNEVVTEITPPQVVSLGCEHSLMPSSADIKINLALHTELVCVNEMRALCEAKLLESKHKQKDDFSRLVIYYPNQRERLWDIARKFNTDIDDLTAINGLSDNEVDKGMVLLIPQK
ncbi:MAG: DUF3794 domain-containing protein [Clostridia bacterium]|nr:DUF3794 domain-containing protein [Clostridia bacterium]